MAGPGNLPEGLSRDPYLVLQVPQTATAKEVKQAYRKRALDLHPDKNLEARSAEDASRAFHELTSAFEFLLDEPKRKEYDRKFEEERKRKVRATKLNAGKRKFAEDLEKREQEAARAQTKVRLRDLREENQEFLASKRAEQLRKEEEKLLERLKKRRMEKKASPTTKETPITTEVLNRSKQSLSELKMKHLEQETMNKLLSAINRSKGTSD